MAFRVARDLAVDFERVAATAVVDATSVTETALGSPVPEAQKPNDAAPGAGDDIFFDDSHCVKS